MAYTAQYTTADLDDIFFDSVMIVGATVNKYIDLLVLLGIVLAFVSIIAVLFVVLRKGVIGGATKIGLK